MVSVTLFCNIQVKTEYPSSFDTCSSTFEEPEMYKHAVLEPPLPASDCY